VDQSVVLLGFDRAAFRVDLEVISHCFQLVHRRNEIGDVESEVASFHVPFDDGDQVGARLLSVCQAEKIVVQ